MGIRDGFNGLLHPDEYGEAGLVDLNIESVRGIMHLGGTTARDLGITFGDTPAG